MARVENSILKGFKGSVGDLIIYERNGQSFVRTKPGKIRDAQTPAQLNQRKKMKLVNDFIQPFKPLISKSFKDDSGRHPYNIAKSYNLRHGTKGEGETLEIDLQNALLCKGTLQLPDNINAEIKDHGILFSWDTQQGNSLDILIVMMRHKTFNQPQFLFTGVQRKVGEFYWDLNIKSLNNNHLCWIAFCDQVANEMSDSKFVTLQR